jgi:hypothetical protein
MFLVFQTMDRVQEAVNTKCNTQLSEAFRIEVLAVGFTLIVLTSV